MTNGEKMISAFPNGEVRKCEKGVVFSTGGWCHAYADEWWNAEYKEPTTKCDSKFCPDRKAKTTNMETILHCIENDCVAYKDGKCLKYNSDQEPTTKNDLGVDCIDRAELLKAIDTWDKFGCDADTKLVPYQDHYIPYIYYDDVIKCIKSMPSVTPLLSVPEVTTLAEWTTKLIEADKSAYSQGYADGMKIQKPRKGHWIYIRNSEVNGLKIVKCSECGKRTYGSGKYCPNCGADMREVEE